MSRLPDFVVIGGMKCGSTTLYRDLLGHADVYVPDKELNVLVDECVTADQYARHFVAAPKSAVCGDVSTTYSMLPDYTGVADRARTLLGRSTKIIYLVRDPVARAISHHRHMHAWHGPGKMGANIDDAVQRHASLVNYGRYAMQLRPWRAVFGDEAISVVVFEHYILNRSSTLDRLCAFLGISQNASHVRADKIYNGSQDKTVLNPFWLAVWKTPIYQRVIRPLMSPDLRESLRRVILPRAPERPSPPSVESVDYLIKNLCEDERELRAFLRWDTPVWDFDLIRSQFCDGERRAA